MPKVHGFCECRAIVSDKANVIEALDLMQLTLSSRIFCTMKVATVLDSSLPISMVRKQSGMISVDSKKLMTSVSSTCTSQEQALHLVDRF